MAPPVLLGWILSGEEPAVNKLILYFLSGDPKWKCRGRCGDSKGTARKSWEGPVITIQTRNVVRERKWWVHTGTTPHQHIPYRALICRILNCCLCIFLNPPSPKEIMTKCISVFPIQPCPNPKTKGIPCSKTLRACTRHTEVRGETKGEKSGSASVQPLNKLWSRHSPG